VTVPTAHKILIATAVAFFAFFALWEVGEYRASGDRLALVSAIAAAAGAFAFGAYLRRFVRSLRES
jgi:hypothetical protein